jgi:hypothetical protein
MLSSKSTRRNRREYEWTPVYEIDHEKFGAG